MIKTAIAALACCAFVSASYAAPPQNSTGPTKLTNTAMGQVTAGSALEGFGDILEAVRDSAHGHSLEGTMDVLEGTRDIVHEALHH